MQQATNPWADKPMTGRQIAVIVMCCVLNAFDGIDILAISFASPGIAAEWAINRAELGVVLSMELIGMTAGSVLFGYLADRLGRRFVVLSCLVVTTLGMWTATHAGSLSALSVIRFVTGLGIGGMIATAHSTASEFANDKRRNFAIACVGLGWPIGAIVGGSIAAAFVSQADWRHVFIAGAAISTAFIPVAWFALPESVSYLLERQPRGALERANKVLAFVKHDLIKALPAIPNRSAGSTIDPGKLLYGLTAVLAFAYFFDCVTYYFLLKWSPKIVADMGFGAASGSSVLVWGTVGQLAALLVTGWVATKVNPRTLVLPAAILTALGVSAFGFVTPALGMLIAVMIMTTFFNQATNTLVILIIIDSFPAAIRTGRLGFVMGVGRGGAALSPIIAGAMLNWGYPLWVVTSTLSLPVLVTGGVLFTLHSKAKMKFRGSIA